MRAAALVVAVTFVAPHAAVAKSVSRAKVDPIVLITDEPELRSYLTPKDDEHVFAVTRDDVIDARRNLERYVWLQMKRTKRSDEALRLRRVLRNAPTYVWHCGGIARKDGRYMYCMLSSFEPGQGLEQPRFPTVADGGARYCQLRYRLDDRVIVSLIVQSDG